MNWLTALFKNKTPTIADLSRALEDMGSESERLTADLADLAEGRAEALPEGDMKALARLDAEASDLRRQLDVIDARRPILEAKRGEAIAARDAGLAAEARTEFAEVLAGLESSLVAAATAAEAVNTTRDRLADRLGMSAPYAYSGPLNAATVEHWRRTVAPWLPEGRE